MQSKRNLIAGVLSSLILLFLCLSCSVTAANAAADRAFIRVVHAAPGIGTINVAVDGEPFLHDFTFATISGYVSLPAGSHHFLVMQKSHSQVRQVLDILMVVSAGVPYTLALLGMQPNRLSLQAFVDDNVLSSDGAKARVYQLAPDANAINLAVDGSIIISHLTFQNVSDYLNVPAGTYAFAITLEQGTTPLILSETLSAETINSLFILGSGGGNMALRVVRASVAGMPGPPITGSDPNAQPAEAAPSWTSSRNFWGSGLVMMFVTGIITGAMKIIRLRNERIIPARNFPSTHDGARPSDLH